MNNKKVALIITTIVSFLTPFGASSVNIALPSIGNELAINAIMLNWIITSYLLTAAVFLVPIGRIADIYGRKKIFLIGISIFTVASLLAAIADSETSLVVFRVLQGFSSAMMFATSMAILTFVFQVGERGKALGINSAAVYLGLSVGPFLGGILTQHFGWRSIFLVNIPLGLIIIFSVLNYLSDDWASSKGEKFDSVGSIIYGLMIISIMYGLSIVPAKIGGGLIIVGIICIMAFIWWETRLESPILDINLFKNNTLFAFSNLAALINYSSTHALMFLLSLYLQYIKGLSPQNAGFILVSQPIIQAVFSPYAGRLSDRIEPGIIASLGMALNAIVLSMFININEKTCFPFIIFSLLILGLGFAFFSSPNTNAVMSSIDQKFYGVASGILATMRLVGQMSSMGIAMLIFSIYIGKVQITADYYGLFLKSIRIAFTIFSILCFGGIFASLARGKAR